MRIYAIRDRLIDYFMTPFAAPNDKEVLGSVAYQINVQEDGNAIAQAPHHYEIWVLAEVQDDGHITPHRELICDCASLVRRDIRGGTAGRPGAPEAGEPAGVRKGTAGAAPGEARAEAGDLPDAAEAEGSPGTKTDPGPRGSP